EPAEASHAAPLATDAEEDDDRPRHERNGVSDDLVYGPADEDNGGLHPIARARASLKDAAAALLQAWDEGAARRMGEGTEGRDDGVAAAIEQLRAALTTKPARHPNTPRKPREGTKQEAVLAMLRRPEGATVAQIAEAMAWEQHTVRGFFADLKRKGITVVAAERVPTAEGWATMGALLVGDTLFDELGQPCRVTGVSRIIIGRRCYTIAFDDGEHIVCDGTHRWPVWDFTNNERPVERLLGTEEMQGRVRIGAGPRYRYAIDCCAPAELPKQDLVIPPYVLGVWLGDGSSIMNHVSVHEDDAEIAEHLSACGVDAQFRLSRWRNGRCANIVIDPTFRLVDDGMTPASIQHRSRFTT
ncbi:MAG: DUF3489 domain-containing protein, partial [Alphaproteobacteria bacterium]|nr:DUF3489 domain-containing protein [Alphaproteobacteria bacterium]